MPVQGDLRSMPLADLLQWIAMSQKSGVVEIEREKIIRRIEFRKGQVGSCWSNDPFSRLGQFLLSRGRIDETQLQHVLTLHKTTERSFGRLLVELKILNRAELAAAVAALGWTPSSLRISAGRSASSGIMSS